MLVTELRYGLDFDDYNRLTAADQIAASTLIYQGGMDSTVAPSVARDLAVAMGTTATLVEKPEAQHVGSWNVGPSARRSDAGVPDQLRAVAAAVACPGAGDQRPFPRRCQPNRLETSWPSEGRFRGERARHP